MLAPQLLRLDEPHREGSASWGGFNLIGRITADREHSTREGALHPISWGQMIADRVHDPTGDKRRRGAGRPRPCPGSAGDAFSAFIGTWPSRASCRFNPIGSMTPG